MELLGTTLLSYFERSELRFSLKTVLLIADQLIEALADMHSQGFLHLDIKPDNIIFGLNTRQDFLYLVDFGLSRRLTPSHAPKHVPSFKGNMIWASVNLLKMLEGSQRDDLEAMLYTLLFLAKGELPWMLLPAADMNFYTVRRYKEHIPPAKLFTGLPAFYEIFLYVRSLKFGERPDYVYIKEKFRKVAEKEGIQYDFQFDWKPLEPISPHRASTTKRKTHRTSSPLKLYRQVARLEANTEEKSPGALIQMCRDKFTSPICPIIPTESEAEGFHLRLTPVIMGQGDPARDVEPLSLDICPLDSPSTTPKSASPTIKPAVREKFKRLKETIHSDN